MRSTSRIVRIPSIFCVLVRPEIDVDDLAHSFDMNELLHHLSADIDRHHVVAGLDKIASAAAAKESAAAFAAPATTGAWCCSTDGPFSRTKIYLARRASSAPSAPSAAETLPAPPTADESAARLHPLSQCSHARRIAARAHGIHAVAYCRHRSGISALRKSSGGSSRIAAAGGTK